MSRHVPDTPPGPLSPQRLRPRSAFLRGQGNGVLDFRRSLNRRVLWIGERRSPLLAGVRRAGVYAMSGLVQRSPPLRHQGLQRLTGGGGAEAGAGGGGRRRRSFAPHAPLTCCAARSPTGRGGYRPTARAWGPLV